LGKTYREGVAIPASQQAAAEDDAADGCPVDENASSTDGRLSGVPMPRLCCDLPCAYNHKGRLQAKTSTNYPSDL